ncbi:MAG: CatA-like O-acetyltransferase [Eubacteriales bacterium]|nr:CatA-like O-acetyltransferase [Eubacteriales bacterium]
MNKNYKRIEVDDFYRKAQYEYFIAMDSPMINITVNLDITDWNKRRKEAKKPFYLSLLYAVAQAANKVPAFRQRLVDGGIHEYENCPVSYTVDLESGAYSYNWLDSELDYETFISLGRKQQDELEKTQQFQAPEDGIRYLWFSSTPWFTYANLDMPRSSKTYSEPIFLWGKAFEEQKLIEENGSIHVQNLLKLPFTMVVNHVLVDGIHLKAILEELEKYMDSMFQQ